MLPGFIVGSEVKAERRFRDAKRWLTPESKRLGFLFLCFYFLCDFLINKYHKASRYLHIELLPVVLGPCALAHCKAGVLWCGVRGTLAWS